MAPALVDGLKALGHRSETTADSYMDYGSGQFIWKLSDDLDDGYVAASDSRRDGQAAGY
jgi:gamma-glutamyltranspeptidase/glutathione hydrolase